MFEETVSFEDDIIDRLDLQNSVKELDPEIQRILYDAYGTQLENMPDIGFMGDRLFAKKIFQRMKQKNCTVLEQKLLLAIKTFAFSIREIRNFLAPGRAG